MLRKKEGTDTPSIVASSHAVSLVKALPVESQPVPSYSSLASGFSVIHSVPVVPVAPAEIVPPISPGTVPVGAKTGPPAVPLSSGTLRAFRTAFLWKDDPTTGADAVGFVDWHCDGAHLAFSLTPDALNRTFTDLSSSVRGDAPLALVAGNETPSDHPALPLGTDLQAAAVATPKEKHELPSLIPSEAFIQTWARNSVSTLAFVNATTAGYCNLSIPGDLASGTRAHALTLAFTSGTASGAESKTMAAALSSSISSLSIPLVKDLLQEGSALASLPMAEPISDVVTLNAAAFLSGIERILHPCQPSQPTLVATDDTLDFLPWGTIVASAIALEFIRREYFAPHRKNPFALEATLAALRLSSPDSTREEMRMTQSLEDLLALLNSGDQAAVEETMRQFEPFLHQVVCRHIPLGLRSKFDPEDIVQSVWRTLLHGFREADRQFVDVDHLRTFSPGPRVTVFWTASANIAGITRTNNRSPNWTPTRHRPRTDPGPGRLLQRQELWEQVLALCPFRTSGIAALRREGHSLDEIAALSGLHRDSIRRAFPGPRSPIGLHTLDGHPYLRHGQLRNVMASAGPNADRSASLPPERLVVARHCERRPGGPVHRGNDDGLGRGKTSPRRGLLLTASGTQ